MRIQFPFAKTTLWVSRLSVVILVLGMGAPRSSNAGPEDVVTQQELLERLAKFNPTGSVWTKPEPGLAYRIPEDPRKIPPVIYNNVGTIDDINKWITDPAKKFNSLDAYFAAMKGSVINLQYSQGKPDFYAIGNNTWETEYVVAEVDEAISGNPKLAANLSKVEGIAALLAAGDPGLIGVKKNAEVVFVRASDLGLPINRPFTVPIPQWGDGKKSQTKPAGEDSFVRFEIQKSATGEVTITSYICGAEPVRLPDGRIVSRPIAYVPAGEFRLWEKLGGSRPEMPAQFVGRSGVDEAGIVRTPDLFGYLAEVRTEIGAGSLLEKGFEEKSKLKGRFKQLAGSSPLCRDRMKVVRSYRGISI